MRMFHRLLTALLLASLPGCNNSMTPSPTNPSTSPTSPSPAAPQSYVVSGTVSETVDGISRPAAGRKVDLYTSFTVCVSGQPNIPCVSEGGGVFVTDHNGRYTAQVTVLPKTRVFVA